jgi:DNA-binding transcriptional ArsR family regulator
VRARASKRDPLDALGNSYRREIVALLARKSRSVQEIANRLPISRPAVSRHLRVLEGAGLVSDEQHGARRVYTLDRRYLSQVWGDIGARFKLFAENTQRSAAPAMSLRVRAASHGERGRS